MKKIIFVIVLLILASGIIYLVKPANDNMPPNTDQTPLSLPVTVKPISHATAVLNWGGQIIYTDPVGDLQQYSNVPKPDIILVTDIHGDHFSTTTLSALVGTSTLIVPQAVKNLMPKSLADRARILANNASITDKGFSITAIPMYNLPEASTSMHTKGRGNGYVIEKNNFRVYIAGDTDDIPEMRSLENIDIAFIPMNPPYTMDINRAAEAVLAFKPKIVYPYHYRGQNGLSDVAKFKEIVDSKNPDIKVILENWYPTSE